MPSPKRIKIVLFEDDPRSGPRIRQAIQRELPGSATVKLFTPSDKRRLAKAVPYEERLSAEVQTSEYADATLWVTDRDLSRTNLYQGLSEAVVSKVAAQLGVPLCKYARGAAQDDVFERQRNWGDAQIVLDASDIKTMATKAAVLAEGFLSISHKLDRLLRNKAQAKKLSTPAEVMAQLIGRPDTADQIALYGSGDQKMVSEFLPFAGPLGHHKQLRHRLPSLFGYWLYDSILRFPGILMNSVATASYVNISVKSFQSKPVARLFDSTLYTGPFNDTTDPHWWRRDIDALFSAAKVEDGNAYATLKLKKKLPRSLDGGKRAGFYCMVTKAPVSEENSVGTISWFPPGADLARVRKDVYEQMGPWLGLF